MALKDKNRLRIKDIAVMANVSVGTVDRVLHNRGEVAIVTRNQVLSLIDKLGYTPNLIAKSLASKKTYTISILIPSVNSNNTYWEKPILGIQQAYSEIRDYNTIVDIQTFDLNNELSFEKAFDEILDKKPDGLILSPIYHDLSLKKLQRFDELNIPYILIDINIEKCNKLAYFGQNAIQSGYLAARLLHYGLPQNSNVIILNIAQKESITFHLKKREEGFLKYFKENPGKFNIISVEIDTISQTDLEKQLDNCINKPSTTSGIFVTNSKIHKVAAYLEKANLKDIILIGYDLIDSNIHYLEKGTIDFLIGQKPEEQGYRSLITLFNFLISKKVPETVNYSPIDIILKDNIDYYKNFKY